MLTIAVPKGRILDELIPILSKVGIIPEDDFFESQSRKLQFYTLDNKIRLIKVRSFDVATFVAYGGAHLGVCGSDVIEEFNYPNIYIPLDLNIGKCRLSIAGPITAKKHAENYEDQNQINHFLDDLTDSHIKIATKYPYSTQKYFTKFGVRAECIKLNGAIELAANLGFCNNIVDLVNTGNTLKENNLQEIIKINDVSSQLIVNKIAYKTTNDIICMIINNFRKVLYGKDS